MVCVQDYGFYIDKYEVTNAQYAAFLNAKGNQSEGGRPWLALADWRLIEQRGSRYVAKSGYAEHPVIGVTWYGAQAFARWVGGRRLRRRSGSMRREMVAKS